jgi:hypothetical protein
VFLFAFSYSELLGNIESQPPVNYRKWNAGTTSNPYKIDNLANLKWLSENQQVWRKPNRFVNSIKDRIAYMPIFEWLYNALETYDSKNRMIYYVQTADIDAYETKYWNDGIGFSPIGYYRESRQINYFQTYSEERRFYGSFDGNNHTIDNLYMTVRAEENYNLSFGFFGATSNATIQNVNLSNTIIHELVDESDSNGSMTIGTLVGIADANTTVKNCSVSGTILVTNIARVGGIVGWSFLSEISSSRSSVDIRLDNGRVVGGVVGSLAHSTLASVFYNGNISIEILDEGWVGGLVGDIYSSTIMNAYFDGSISITNNNTGLIGSIVGIGDRDIMSRLSDRESIISNVYSTSSEHFGLLGVLDKTFINNAFWVQTAQGVPTPFKDYDNPRVVNVYGLTIDEMKQKSTFASAGWDFDNVWVMEPHINDGFPHLAMNNP